MIKFLRSNPGLFVLLNVGFVGGLLAATGFAFGAGLWFGLMVALGIGFINDKSNTKVNSLGGGGTMFDETDGEDEMSEKVA